MQFLNEQVAQCSQEVLCQRLFAFFELQAEINYSKEDQLQMDDDTEHIFRPTDLGFGQQATTCGAPRLHTCLSLINASLTDGFVTQGEPLRIREKQRQ